MKRALRTAYYDPVHFMARMACARPYCLRSIIGSGIAALKKTGLWILLLMALSVSSFGYAHGHRGDRNRGSEAYRQAGEGRNGGGEFAGQIAAWLLGIANFPVVLSVLLKAGAKAAPEGTNFGAAAARINRKQKQYLMRLHYWLNPVAIGIAIVHFSLTECRAAFIPELGLGLMLLVCVLGLMVTFKLSPVSIRKAVFNIHTSPIVLVACIAVLFIGHSMID
jgi:hypothetical protein